MPAAQAAAELAKHVPQITMHPADQNGDRNYVCQGDWNLRENLTYHGHVLMVAGVDLSPRPLGYEPKSTRNFARLLDQERQRVSPIMLMFAYTFLVLAKCAEGCHGVLWGAEEHGKKAVNFAPS